VKKIAILGGGYGGVATAKKLIKNVKKNEEVSITLIDRNPFHTLMTELHEVAGGRVEEDAVRISLKKIFAGTPVNVVVDSIENIDFDKKVLNGTAAEYEYDYLVLGVGAEPEFFGVEGASEHSFTLWSYDDAIRIREHIENSFLKASRTPDLEERQKLLTFAVAGAGFTGVEMLGELLEWKDKLCKHYGIDSGEVRIILVEAMRDILPVLPKKLRDKAVKFITKKGGEVLLDSPISKVTPDTIQIKDQVIPTKCLIWTCGIRGASFAGKLQVLHEADKSRQRCQNVGPDGTCQDDTNLRFNISKKCRIISNEYIQCESHDEVYVIGDVGWHLEGHKALPQIVETALQTGELAAVNILKDMRGEEKEKFKSNLHGVMISVGSKWAVANLMGVAFSGFMAMAMKHLVNLHYLWSVGGFNTCWEYMMARFFGVKNNRSMVGGMASVKINGLWALPMRLWLGLMWVIEGVNKVGEGWFNFEKGTSSSWMFSPGVVQAGLPEAADAASAASDAGEWAEEGAAAAETVVEATTDAASAASEWVEEGAAAASELAGDAVEAAKHVFAPLWDLSQPILSWDNPLVTFFRETFMDGIAAHIPFQFFQVSIVAVEVALGLALMAGLFTFPAAAVTIVMCFVFILSGLFSWSQLWFIFAAIVLMGGAGRAFGLDNWVMPFLGKWYKRIPFVKKHHLFMGE